MGMGMMSGGGGTDAPWWVGLSAKDFSAKVNDHDQRKAAADAAAQDAAQKVAELERVSAAVKGRESEVGRREQAAGVMEKAQADREASLKARDAALSAREVAVGRDAADKEAALKARSDAVLSREMALEHAEEKAAEARRAADALKADYESRLAKLKAITG